MEGVAHTVALGLEITLVVDIGGNLDGHVLHDFESVSLQTHTLHGIVGEQTHLVDIEMTQHLRATTIVALVGLKAEMHIGIHRVITLLL